MIAASLLGLAAGCTLIFGGIKKKAKTERQKIVAEIAYTLSYAFLAVEWIVVFKEETGNNHKQIFCMVMFILCSLVTLLNVVASIAMVIDYHQHKEAREAEYSIKKLQGLYNECEKKFSKYVGVNKVIKRLTEFCQENSEFSQLVTSVKQVFTLYLPEYIKVYTKYVEAIDKVEFDEKNLLAEQMKECSEKFLQRIQEAGEEQETFEESLRENQLSTKSSDFEASAEAFNAMVDVQDEFSFVQEAPEIPQRNNSNDKNKKQERMLFYNSILFYPKFKIAFLASLKMNAIGTAFIFV